MNSDPENPIDIRADLIACSFIDIWMSLSKRNESNSSIINVSGASLSSTIIFKLAINASAEQNTMDKEAGAS
jgi:hypothetical protein